MFQNKTKIKKPAKTGFRVINHTQYILSEINYPQIMIEASIDKQIIT